MHANSEISGVIPAVATPLTKDDRPDIETLQHHIQQLEADGCSGVLLMGTTGEGPSLGLEERISIIREGKLGAGSMKVLAGTGCASLSDTILLTRRAFDLGADAVLVVPPFYYKNLSDQGLGTYYRRILKAAVPTNGSIFLYHIPQVTHVPISKRLLEELVEHDPKRVTGIKDSSGDLDNLKSLCEQEPRLRVFTGNDSHFLSALQFGASGCITAVANVFARLAVDVLRAFDAGEDADALQVVLTEVRKVLGAFQPFAASIKFLLAKRYGLSGWNVRPPLVPLPTDRQKALMDQLSNLDLSEWIDWM
jgi:4-hydroxy-tetrahydrodipicolinate synthase